MPVVCRSDPDDTNHNMLGISLLRLEPTFSVLYYSDFKSASVENLDAILQMNNTMKIQHKMAISKRCLNSFNADK